MPEVLAARLAGTNSRAKVHQTAETNHGHRGRLADADGNQQWKKCGQQEHGETGGARDGDMKALPKQIADSKDDGGALNRRSGLTQKRTMARVAPM